MTQVQSIFDAAIKTGLAPPLKRAGFRKQALAFHRRHGACYHVIQVQKSQGNSADCLRFYLDVGLGAPDLWAQAGHAVGPVPKPHECQVFGRYEQLLYGAAAHLEVLPSTGVEALAEELCDLAGWLVITLDPVTSPDALLELPMAVGDDRAAQIHYHYGRDTAALAALERHHERFAERRGTTPAEVAKRLGLNRLL
ncbi:MAG: DUF4304 domain-containing protein [Pseudomonadota bacterium]